MIRLTIEEAAQKRGITTQKQLAQVIKEKTGEEMRPSTISDLYRNNKTAINKEYLLLVMRGLETVDFNEILTIE